MCTHLNLMMDKDNPNRLFKENSIICNSLRCMVCLLVTITILVGYYFLTIGLGLGMTRATVGPSDYCDYDNQHIAKFYAGCIFIGLISEIVLFLGICILLCFGLCIRLILVEIRLASQAAEHLQQNMQPAATATDTTDDVIIQLED